ncbi:hypothetical protein ACEQPO_03070 [Bacillus sp. SL00103]
MEWGARLFGGDLLSGIRGCLKKTHAPVELLYLQVRVNNRSNSYSYSNDRM